MMALSKYDAQKLRHDCKRIAKGFKIARDEHNEEKKNFVMDLLLDEFDRLLQDIDEMAEEKKPREDIIAPVYDNISENFNFKKKGKN